MNGLFCHSPHTKGSGIISTENGAAKKCIKQTTWTMLWQDVLFCHFLSLGCFSFADLYCVMSLVPIGQHKAHWSSSKLQ
ncbi:hypothetical protein PO909_012744 [Leuciscus waleckii]